MAPDPAPDVNPDRNPDLSASLAAIPSNIAHIRERIHAACRRAARSTDSVELMAVSKQQPVEAILAAADCGLTAFGENRVQEFATKVPALAAANPDLLRILRFHMIGHLQSNKASRAAEIFSAVDSLDSLALARKLDAAAPVPLPVLLEIKLSPEAAKTGLLPDSAELHILLERLPELPSLSLRGLMTVPPFSDEAEAARPYFRRLRLLRDSLAARYPRLDFSTLSMGMSHDFEVAIEEGSTTIRIGTAIFGKRTPPAATTI
jgi:pyridoxal phosphate enzyme (YggS family)